MLPSALIRCRKHGGRGDHSQRVGVRASASREPQAAVRIRSPARAPGEKIEGSRVRPLGLPLISRDQTFEVHALRNAVLLLLLVALVAVACVRFVRPSCPRTTEDAREARREVQAHEEPVHTFSVVRLNSHARANAKRARDFLFHHFSGLMQPPRTTCLFQHGLPATKRWSVCPPSLPCHGRCWRLETGPP